MACCDYIDESAVSLKPLHSFFLRYRSCYSYNRIGQLRCSIGQLIAKLLAFLYQLILIVMSQYDGLMRLILIVDHDFGGVGRFNCNYCANVRHRWIITQIHDTTTNMAGTVGEHPDPTSRSSSGLSPEAHHPWPICKRQ